MSVPALTVDRISLRLGAFALQDISLSVETGQILVILGPSGAGKSVLLETIAGFHRPGAGRILIGGRDVTHEPPERRRAGFMFQDYALFPHLTVAGNITFGLHPGWEPGRAAAQVRGLMARLGLEPLSGRKPAGLSGGEKQRVAFARALAAEPLLFLFDEPLSALDASARGTLRDDLKALLREIGIPTIFVTHDQTEAQVLADQVAVMRSGRLVQVGTPDEVFNRPADWDVARFVGVENILEGCVTGMRDGLARIELPQGLTLDAACGSPVPAARVFACMRPEDISLRTTDGPGPGAGNPFRARVVAIEAMGAVLKVSLDCGFNLTAFLTRQTLLELGVTVGDQVWASVRAEAVHLLDR